jgi:hypothetical protein
MKKRNRASFPLSNLVKRMRNFCVSQSAIFALIFYRDLAKWTNPEAPILSWNDSLADLEIYMPLTDEDTLSLDYETMDHEKLRRSSAFVVG